MEANGAQPMQMQKSKNGTLMDAREKEKDIRMTNIMAAKAVADVVRTSLGPRGMDKMVFPYSDPRL
jgi:T-complex protein 1 subunit delta